MFLIFILVFVIGFFVGLVIFFEMVVVRIGVFNNVVIDKFSSECIFMWFFFLKENVVISCDVIIFLRMCVRKLIVVNWNKDFIYCEINLSVVNGKVNDFVDMRGVYF